MEQTFKEAERLESEIILSLNTISECKRNYEKVLLTDPESELAMIACFKLGKLNEVFGHYEEAIDYYRKLLTLFPAGHLGAGALLNMAQIYQLHLEEPDNAIITYKQLLHFYPESELRLTALLHLGQYRSRKEEWEKAVLYFQQIVREFPHEKVSDEICFRIADICMHKLDDRTQAHAWYHRLLENYPRSPWVEVVRKRLTLENANDNGK